MSHTGPRWYEPWNVDHCFSRTCVHQPRECMRPQFRNEVVDNIFWIVLALLISLGSAIIAIVLVHAKRVVARVDTRQSAPNRPRSHISITPAVIGWVPVVSARSDPHPPSLLVPSLRGGSGCQNQYCISAGDCRVGVVAIGFLVIWSAG